LNPPAGPATLAKVTHALEAAPSKVPPVFRGRVDGWLRVLRASDLLELVNSDRATEAMWRQSRLSSLVWRRDLLPALHRYADYVQLMPASESHHHAHVGGLLAHTLEMTLAAMTWRNGHFFPEGAPVEEMDAQRDEWTYVVFFGALLHDVGKIMADLRISWSCSDMDGPIRWVPMSGPLTEMVQQRPGGEYLVEFTPKSVRDYQAHSKLPMILMQQIAPPSALSFLARRPQAFDALTQYLSGGDKTSLLAKIVSKADQASTQQALATGNRARFATSSSVPLIDLLMQSIKDMLRTGTSLPLNRSGAAGWVFDGAIWFVAKRLADGVRSHVKQHHPDESIPGENKNDRLFDTWQEYGCIQLNPQSGQAVWYVQVHGALAAPAGEPAGQAGEGATYSHSLTVLRFPLDKVFGDESLYPPAMIGRIEVVQKRGAASPDQDTGANTQSQVRKREADSDNQQRDDARTSAAPTATTAAQNPVATSSTAQVGSSIPSRPFRKKSEPALRAPSFGKPITAPAKPKPPKGTAAPTQAQEPKAEPVPTAGPTDTNAEPLQIGGPDGFSKWLDFEDDAMAFKAPPVPVKRAEAPDASRSTPVTAKRSAAPTAPKAPRAAPTEKSATPVVQPEPPARASAALPPMPEPLEHRTLLARAGQTALSERTAPLHLARMQQAPVVLTPFLPDLPHEIVDKQVEPTASAREFMSWLQRGLASRELKYNETGALVHFTAEGMALVSPLVFKTFVADQLSIKDSQAEAQALQVQREVLKAGWHLMGPGKTNILRYQVLGRGNVAVGKLSAVVLIRPERWVIPVPPSNPVLQIS
jgi:integrating conjugative element relaxase (TIGR03760 family)